MTRPTIRGRAWRLLIASLRTQHTALTRVLAWSLVEALPALLSGALVAAALDRGFLAGRPLVGLTWLAALGLAMAVKAVATRMIFPYLGAVVEPVRDAFVTAVVGSAVTLATAGAGRFDSASVARLTGQVETVRGLVSGLLRTVRQLSVSLVMAVVGLVAMSRTVALIVVPPVVLALAVFACLLPALSRRHRALVLAEERIAEAAEPVFSGVRDIVACGAEQRAATTVTAAIDAHARAVRAVAWAATSRSLVLGLGCQLPLVALLAAAPWLARTGRLSAGEVVGAVTYFLTGLQPALRALVGVLGPWGTQLNVVLQRMGEVWAVPPVADRPLGNSGHLPIGFHLEIRGITFAYGPAAEPVLQNLRLSVPEGQHLAVVGPSGIGKSTLANLLAGLTKPDRGEVLLGEAPLASIDEHALRQTVALIPQEAYVFAGSLRDNLTYLAAGAAQADLDRAVDAVGLRPLVDRLGGYDRMLGDDGPVLSSGELQLIALARVYLCPARVVILDEATCHLDPMAEAQAETAFASRKGTLVVIAHRISSARRADRILLMDGAGPRAGSHEELLAASSLYADLVGHWNGTQLTKSRPH